MSIARESRSYERAFPFEYVRENWGPILQSALRSDGIPTALVDIHRGVLINCLFVWVGSRPMALPQWSLCDEEDVKNFITLLNEISSEVPSQIGHVEKIQILRQLQLFRNSKERIQQRLIARRNHPRISLSEDPLDDKKIGLLLGMYPTNVEAFAQGHIAANKNLGFEVREAKSHCTIFVEVFSDSDLKSRQLLQGFCDHCTRLLSDFNYTMRKLGLDYKFYGEVFSVSHSEAKTKDVFGVEYFGEKERCNQLG